IRRRLVFVSAAGGYYARGPRHAVWLAHPARNNRDLDTSRLTDQPHSHSDQRRRHAALPAAFLGHVPSTRREIFSGLRVIDRTASTDQHLLLHRDSCPVAAGRLSVLLRRTPEDRRTLARV